MVYKIEFTGPIRGHRVCRDNWTLLIGEKLNFKQDQRDEALTFDKYALGVYKRIAGNDALVGHIPIEISHLLNHFLIAIKDENYLEAEVLGKRKRDIGKVLTAKYKATTKDKRFANILREKLEEKKKTLNIDIVDGEFKKFSNKKNTKEYIYNY